MICLIYRSIYCVCTGVHFVHALFGLVSPNRTVYRYPGEFISGMLFDFAYFVNVISD